ncbi:MAG TPA: polysaccharide deacetylase family protein [Armatimonadota bacterium]|nr:polysaccharide deacetylase family protein [Armatimonadota bacterium]
MIFATKSLTRRLLPLFLLILALPVRADDYTQTLKTAVSKLELGQYDAAAGGAEQLLIRNQKDTLAHMLLGVVYLHVGRFDEAQAQLKQVTENKPDEWRAYYALGLLDVLRRRPADADIHFDYAWKFPEARPELSALRGYLAFLDGTPPKQTGETPLDKQTAGMAALKAKKKDQARALLSDIFKTPAPPGFFENRQPIVTFDPKQPIALPGGKLTWKPVAPKDAPTVNGVVTLKADASKAKDTYFVIVYVDDAMAGMTNCYPFEFQWNTANYPNGLHRIKVEAKNQAGGIVSTKSVWVTIANLEPRNIAPAEQGDVADLTQRLWDCMRVGESKKSAHYRVARLDLEAGDTRNAIKQLEYVAAYQANYMDATKLLNRLRGRKLEYSEIKEGKPGGKRIALTFDDGPNENTPAMLEVLDKLGVRATFFIVGFRAEEQPALVRAMVASGHEIENHTYSHPRLTTLTPDEAEAEVAKGAAVITAITGRSSKYFRPPGGHADADTKQAAGRQGFTGVFWTLSVSAFEGARYEALADYVIKNATDGAIIAMHNGEPATTSALPKIVEALRAKGFRFVTLSEMADGLTH